MFFVFCGQHLAALVPFNPQLDTSKTYQPLQFIPHDPTNAKVFADPTKDPLRGSLRMMDKNTLKLDSDESHASRSVNGSVWVFDKNWKNPIKRPERWVTWSIEDEKNNVLFRPFIFYDVMGMMEGSFYKNVDVKTYLSNTQARKNILSVALKPTAVDMNTSPFAKELVQNLRNWHKKGLVAESTPGKVVVLDGYFMWYEGMQDKTKSKISYTDELLKHAQRHWDFFKGTLSETGMMGFLKQCDIRFLQEKFPGAVFQVASNFNCLEGGIEKHALEDMQKSPVQGELCVSCTMGGGIIRKYFIPLDQRNLLADVNGAQIGFDKWGSITVQFKKKLSDKDIPDFAVGIHQNVMVTGGYYPPFVRMDDDLINEGAAKKNRKLDDAFLTKSDLDVHDQNALQKNNDTFDKERFTFLFANGITAKDRILVFPFNGVVKNNIFVHQIFNSALSLARNSSDTTEIENAQVILKAMYEGTVLAAAKLFIDNNVPVKNRYLFLTLLGAGAFWNEIEWIMDALNQPIIIDTIRATGMTAVIVIYPDVRAGRGLDTRKYNERDHSMMTAIPGIYVGVDTINTAINNKIDPAAASAAVEKLAQALRDVK